MADELENAVTAPAASTVAPSAEAAPSTEVIAPVIADEPASTPEVKAEPEAKVEPKADPKTLIGGDKPEEKTAEAPKDEPKLEEPKIESPVYEPFTLPEGVTVDEVKLGEFTKALSDFELTSKAPHEEVQKLGQQLVEKHIAEIQRYTESLKQAWEKQKTDWRDSFLKSPEFANRTDTVVNSAIDAINVFGGDTKQQQEFRELMESSGVGNHPAMIRLLSNVMLAKSEPKPLAAPQIAVKATQSKIQKMYGAKP